MSSVVPSILVRDQIAALAKRRGIAYSQTPGDRTADAMARLAGELSALDETERLLVALERSGHVTADEVDRLHFTYLEECADKAG